MGIFHRRFKEFYSLMITKDFALILVFVYDKSYYIVARKAFLLFLF